MEIVAWIGENWQAVLLALGALLSAVLMVLRLIPGAQGEPFIQKMADFIKNLTANKK